MLCQKKEHDASIIRFRTKPRTPLSAERPSSPVHSAPYLDEAIRQGGDPLLCGEKGAIGAHHPKPGAS